MLCVVDVDVLFYSLSCWLSISSVYHMCECFSPLFSILSFYLLVFYPIGRMGMKMNDGTADVVCGLLMSNGVWGEMCGIFAILRELDELRSRIF